MILDQEEMKIYHKYMKVPYKIAKNSSLDYNSYTARNPNEIVI